MKTLVPTLAFALAFLFSVPAMAAAPLPGMSAAQAGKAAYASPEKPVSQGEEDDEPDCDE